MDFMVEWEQANRAYTHLVVCIILNIHIYDDSDFYLENLLFTVYGVQSTIVMDLVMLPKSEKYYGDF